jgi:hypothetical protein
MHWGKPPAEWCLLPNSAHMSVSSLYQFLVLTDEWLTMLCGLTLD